MGRENVSLQVVARLNEALSIKQLQGDLNRIASKLRLNVSVNTDAMQKLQKQVQQIQQQLHRSGQGVRIIDDKEAIRSINRGRQGIRELYTDIDSAVKRYSQLGEVKLGSQTLDPVTRQVRAFDMEIKRADGSVQKLRMELARAFHVDGRQMFEVVGRRQVVEAEKHLGQIRRKFREMTAEEQKLANQMAAGREKANQKRIKEEQTLAKNQQNAINKNMERQRKSLNQEKQKTQELQKQLQLYQQQARTRVQNLQRTHGHGLDPRQVQHYLNSVNQLSTATPDLSNKMRQLNQRFSQLSANARDASQSVGHSSMAVSEMMRTALVKFPIWMASATIFYAPLRFGRDLVETLIDINSYTTILSRVSNGELDVTRMLSESVDMANRLGVALTDLQAAIEGYARQGFRGDELLHMAEASTLMTNVSTLSGEEAMSALTATVMAFRMETEQAIDAVDKFNEVD